MRNILIIGAGAVDALGRALADDGFQVTVRQPGQPDHEDLAGFNVLIVQLAEDAATKRLIDGGRSKESPPIIALLDAASLDQLDLTASITDFFVFGSDPRELTTRVRQILWNRHQVDAQNLIRGLPDLIHHLDIQSAESVVKALVGLFDCFDVVRLGIHSASK